MKASDLSIIDVLDFYPENGLIELAKRRVMIFDGNIIMELRRMLVENLGWANCKPMIFQYGFHVGFMDAEILKQSYEWSDLIELVKAGPVMQTHRGHAKTVLNTIAWADGRLTFQGRWYNSFEVDSHKILQLTRNEKVCYVLSGYLSGFTTACFDRDVLVREQSCFSDTGRHGFCEFEGRLAEEWGEVGEEMRMSARMFDLRQKYRDLDDKLALIHKRRIARVPVSPVSPMRPQDGSEIFYYRSNKMKNVFERAHKVAQTDATVLLTGETGVGKEIIGNYIHQQSKRSQARFLGINCTALPETLLESELFGHRKGAFTGADHDKEGLFLQAGDGTMFLDEIGDIPPAIQVKLLRALQERRVRPVGGSTEKSIEARLIASTNRDLNQMMVAGKFRSDLFFRLNVFPIHIPALRERRGEIIPMARYLLAKFAPNSRGISPQVAALLEAYDWPGNIRELQNAIEHASILAGNRKIQMEHLPATLTRADQQSTIQQVTTGWPSMANLEKGYIFKVLDYCGGRKSKAAEILGIGYNTLWRKLKIYDAE